MARRKHRGHKRESKKEKDKRNKYLGKRVPDIGRPGLDTLTEVKGIVKAIIEDVKKHRITYRKGMSRMNLLSLIVSRSKNFRGRKGKRAEEIINRGRINLKKLGGKLLSRRRVSKISH